MENIEEKEIEFDEKLWDLIKIVLKKKPGATVKMVCYIIGMSAQGKLYTPKDIEKCISYAIANNFLIVDKNGKLLEKSKEDIKEDNTKQTIEQFQQAEEQIQEKVKKQEEARAEKKMGGYFLSSRKNDSNRGR